MSISHKKINSMIGDVVSAPEFESYEFEAFGDLCRKIYLIESSLDQNSNKKNLGDIMDEISMRALSVVKEDQA